MEELDTQTILIVGGGVAFLIVLAAARGALRRRTRRSRSTKERSRPKSKASRRSPPKSGRSTGPVADDLMELARKAGLKPARSADREVGRVAKVSSSAAIPLAWAPVEQGIDRAVARLAAKSGDLEAESTMDKLRFLESKSRLSDDQARVLHRMRQLRNRAAHGELASDEVDAAAARAYSRVARALIGVLDKLR